MVNERNSGRSVSTKMIMQEARKVAEQREIQNFKENEGRSYTFMEWQGLSMHAKTSIAQRMPADYEDEILSLINLS